MTEKNHGKVVKAHDGKNSWKRKEELYGYCD